MLADARAVPTGTELDTDICIIGCGAAGIALGRALVGSRANVVLLESGGMEADRDTQSLYEGESIGLDYYSLQGARLRFFGGSTNHWGGLCARFRAMDFEGRDWIPSSNWPISLADVEPHYPAAREVVQLTSDSFDAASWLEQDPNEAFDLGPDVTARVAQMVQKSRRSFGEAYRDELELARNATVYLYANVVELETDQEARTVTAARVATLDRTEFRVRARHFVLATGGIENARLLLASNRVRPAGLGNDHDLVGRYFLEHPRFDAGMVVPFDRQLPARFYEPHNVDGTRIQGYLVLPDDVQRREGLVDVQLLTHPVYTESFEQAEVSDVETLRRLVRSPGGNLPDIGRDLLDVTRDLTTARAFVIPGSPLPVPYPDVVGRVVTDDDPTSLIPPLLGNIAAFGYRAVTGAAPLDHILLRTRLDPAPNPDSRVTLSDERDALGMPRARLDWRLSAIDRHSAARTMEIVGAAFAASGLARVRLLFDPQDEAWPDTLAGGWHHMGTTRMSDDARYGVVDRHCRVHGIANLHVAGSSVFCTGGSATPTMTIVALALRLADRLRSLVR